jgi:hypothetical protein
MKVTRSDFSPRIRDTDDGLVQVFLAEANAAEVAARSSPIWTLGKSDGVLLCRIEFVTHLSFSSLMLVRMG